MEVPVIYIEFVGAKEQFYVDLCNVLLSEAASLGLKLQCRTSFGFRNISFEYFKLIEEEKYILKIAPGILRGVNHQIVISVLEKVAGEWNL